MSNRKIRNLAEFKRWVKIRLVEEEISQRELAKRMGIPHARISEATHGKKTGYKYIVPVIEHLGGDLKDFKGFLKMIDEERTIARTGLSHLYYTMSAEEDEDE